MGQLPVCFGELKNVRRKTAVHDEEWFSPVVWGNHVRLTTARKDERKLFAARVDFWDGRIVYHRKVFDFLEPPADHGFNSHRR